MMREKIIATWDEIYQKQPISIPNNKDIGNDVLNKSLDWLCDSTEAVLYFGCGSGTVLFYCALRGVTNLKGIDISEQAILKAKKRAAKMSFGGYDFICGDRTLLSRFTDSSIDGVILFNILDNLPPEEALRVLQEVHRLLKDNGKVIIKVNPFLTKKQISKWNIKVIKDNLLDDGFCFGIKQQKHGFQSLQKFLRLWKLMKFIILLMTKQIDCFF